MTTTQTTGRPALIAIGLCLLAAMIEGFDIAAMGVAAPKMIPALGLSKPEAGWAFSASLIGLLFGAALAGPLSDRVGRKPVLLVAVAAFGLFSLGTGMVHAYEPLLLMRFLTGLGLGGGLPTLVALASELASPGRRTAVVSGVTAGMPLGGVLVGLLARTDLAVADWRIIFMVGGAAPLLLVMALWVWLPETGTSREARVPGAGLAALFGPGRLGTTISLWIALAATAMVLHLFLNWLPSLLVARGVEGKAAAGISTLFNLGGAMGGVLVGLTIDRMGSRWPLAAAVAGLIAVLLALAVPGAGLATTAALAFALGFLVMALQFGLYGVAPSYYAPPVRGTGTGAAIAAGRFGSILGPVLAGQLLGGGATTGQVVMSTVPIVLLAGAAAILLTVVGRRQEG